MDQAGRAVRQAHPIGDRRETIGVGRHARLELIFGSRGRQTFLRHAYAEPPFRVARCFDRAEGVLMILPWAAPGIFAGDCLSQQVHVERGARVRLTSQSALQAHPSASGRCATISSTFIVDDDAELDCRWDPLIPFAASTVNQRNDVRLAPTARLFWSDAFMCGRVESGERWAFAELKHELRVERNASLEYLERYCIVPAEQRATRAWAAGGASYFGTVLSSGRVVAPELVLQLQQALTVLPSVEAVADRLDSRLLVARLMAARGAPFRDARSVVDRFVAAESLLDMPVAGPHSGELFGGPV